MILLSFARCGQFVAKGSQSDVDQVVSGAGRETSLRAGGEIQVRSPSTVDASGVLLAGRLP